MGESFKKTPYPKAQLAAERAETSSKAERERHEMPSRADQDSEGRECPLQRKRGPEHSTTRDIGG